jgi:hypothetical protein
MALSTTITKKSVTLVGDGKYTITYNLLYKDGETTLIDRDFSQTFKPGMAWSTTVTALMRDEMKKAIANYKAEKAIYDGAPIAASVQNLNETVGV